MVRNGYAPNTAQGWGWGTFILPQMDQAPMYNSMNVNVHQIVCDVPLPPTDNPAVGNPASGRYVLPAFICPTATDPDVFYACNGPTTNQHSKSNYVAVCGVDFTGVLTNANLGADYNVGMRGIFGDATKHGCTKIRDETDGTSNTFMIGEAYRKDNDGNYTNWISGVGGERRPGHWFGLAADDQTACVVRQLRTTGVIRHQWWFVQCIRQPAQRWCVLPDVGSARYRFISENGDQSTISRFGTINDNKVVDTSLGL